MKMRNKTTQSLHISKTNLRQNRFSQDLKLHKSGLLQALQKPLKNEKLGERIEQQHFTHLLQIGLRGTGYVRMSIT